MGSVKYKFLLCIALGTFLLGCKEHVEQKKKVTNAKEQIVPPLLVHRPDSVPIPENMVWIPGGQLEQGAVAKDKMAMYHEKPAFKVEVDGFFMDATEVTNAQFSKFVSETGYVTLAERPMDWSEMKKQLPEGTEKPHDSILRPSALTFKKAKEPLPNLYDFSQWWKLTIGANWRHPNGPKSSIKGQETYPVVQIAYEDALAYCEWAGRRLPTEAEWEWAARGGDKENIFFWGDDVSQLHQMANTWEGTFPLENSEQDGYVLRAPVKTYEPNNFGLYDMAGNVWEWTSDWYNTSYYKSQAAQTHVQRNPLGAASPYNSANPYAREKVIKGGSFLCSDSYCASYRVSARMQSSMDSALEHTGFRTVATVAMVQNQMK